ncbi:hypothetical protein PGT21_032284 [Puccinia graminis f. sp. tritici]|uniref:Uncharacterized protein n=1 Tax=Puccinia graminis f. sp. tritici TaxID=56615 RepID=A0A5B0Q7G4_PUCGR|nr:hypothetical protein PGT21_032284 [Puccinia graminis f. sp. tritici]
MLTSLSFLRVACCLFLICVYVPPGVSASMWDSTGAEKIAEGAHIGRKRPASSVDESSSYQMARLDPSSQAQLAVSSFRRNDDMVFRDGFGTHQEPLAGQPPGSQNSNLHGSMENDLPGRAESIGLGTSSHTKHSDRRIGCGSYLSDPQMDSHHTGFGGSRSSLVIPKDACFGNEVLGSESIPYTVHTRSCQDLCATSKYPNHVALGNFQFVERGTHIENKINDESQQKFDLNIPVSELQEYASDLSPGERCKNISPGSSPEERYKGKRINEPKGIVQRPKERFLDNLQVMQKKKFQEDNSEMVKYLNSKKRRPKEMKINQAYKKGFHNSFEFKNHVNSLMGKNLISRNGRAINLERNSFENEESDTLMKSDYFHCKEKGNNFWAWISMIWEATPGKVISEVHKRSQDFASKLEEAISEKFMIYKKNESQKYRSQSDQISLHSHLVYFVNALWCFNYRLLNFVSYDSGNEVYLQEQDMIQNWLLYVVSVDEDEEVIDCLSNGHQQAYITPRETKITQSLFKYIFSDPKALAYHVSRNHSFNSAQVEISERDIFLVKAVVQVMGNYYKLQNQVKWLEVFKDEETFLTKLARIQRYISISQYDERRERHYRKNTSTSLPWKEGFPLKSLGKFINIDEHSQWLQDEFLDRFVKSWPSFQNIPIPKVRGPVPLQLGKMDLFDMGKQYNKFWAWISMIKSYKQDTQYLEEELKSSLWNEKSFQELKNNVSTNTVHDFVREKLDEFLDSLWLYNSVLLRLYGRELTEMSYYQEQKEVQEWFLKLYEKGDTSSEYLERIDKSLFGKFFVTTRETLVYEVLKFSPRSRRKSIEHVKIYKSDPHLSEALIYALGCYYKRNNPGKWKAIFKEDQNLSSLFFNIQCKIFSSEPGEEFNFFNEFKTTNMLPWKDDIGKLNVDKIHPSKRRSPFQRPLTNKLDLERYVKDYQY